MDITTIGKLPLNYTPINNGWSIFLSGFFSFFSFENSISYMELQRMLSIIISTFTFIPIYYLCRKFVNSSFSIVGAAIFVFEPRIIQNSLLGISDPLYIFLSACSLALIFDSRGKLSYFAFILSGLATIVRSEGLFLFIAISIIFILKSKKNKIIIPKYIIAGIIFFLIIMPISSYKIDVQGTDGLFYRISSSINTSLDPPTEIDPNWVTPPRSLPDAILTSLENFPKYLIWDFIPIFIFFVPIGIIFLFREMNWMKIGVIVSMISMSLPALFAYSLPLEETRYFYFIYPLFCIVSVLALPKMLNRFKNQNLVIVLLIIGILISSSIFMQFKMLDTQHETEAYMIAKYISENTIGVNQYYPESIYIIPAQIPKSTQELQSYFFLEREDKISIKSSTLNKISIIPTKNFNSLNEFIEYGQKLGLTHIIIDDKDRNNFLDQTIFNAKKFSFLTKVFDSRDKQFDYVVQIYEIDFERYFKMKNNND
jgi:hypothetical protein